MAYDAGVAFLSVVPSFKGAVEAIGAQATRWGEETGGLFKKSFESQVDDLKIGIDTALNPGALAETSAKLDAETRDRTVHINTELNGGGLGLLSAVLGGALKPLGIGGLIAAASPLLGILPVLIGLLGGVATAFGAAALAAGAFGAVAVTAITEALKGGKGMDPWLKHLRAQLLAGESAFGAFFDRVTQMELPVISKLVGQWIGVGIKILPDFTPLIAAGGLGMEAFTKNLTPAFTNPAFKQFLDQMAKVAPGVLGGLGKVLANVGEGFANLAQAFMPLVPLVTKGFVAMSGAFVKWAMSLQHSKAFQQFIHAAEMGLPLVGKLIGGVVGVLDLLIGGFLQLSTVMEPVLAAIVQGFGKAPAVVEKFIAAVVRTYNHFGDLRQVVATVAGAIATGFGKAVSWAEQLVGGLVRWLHTHWAQISADASIAWNIVSTFVKIAWEVITSIIAFALKFIVPILQVAWSVIFEAVKFTWELISTVIGTAITVIIWTVKRIGGIISFLVGVWQTVTSDIHTAWDAVTTWFKKLPGRIVAAIGDAKTLLFNVGKDIVTGLWNGIVSVATWLKNKISGLAGDVVGWAKGVLGIHSPSSVFAQIGLSIGDGLAAGLLASTNKVNAASRGMLSGLTGTGDLGLVSNAAIMASVGVSGAINLGSMGNNSVLAALQRIESAIHLEGAAPTGAAVSTKIDSKLANLTTLQTRAALAIARSM